VGVRALVLESSIASDPPSRLAVYRGPSPPRPPPSAGVSSDSRNDPSKAVCFGPPVAADGSVAR
jgi:hypothetical protein